eukprot:TRINITY_DN1651_c0_g1_i4.p1 TRINITY_DN1651_c0_g1~~TRINITY_DN1651_c0_g1_i4.p1  ORF type:complete len:196 (-),score=19.29 TRINITY_DN1651_c0_g1_i4:22-609(-)
MSTYIIFLFLFVTIITGSTSWNPIELRDPYSNRNVSLYTTCQNFWTQTIREPVLKNNLVDIYSWRLNPTGFYSTTFGPEFEFTYYQHVEDHFPVYGYKVIFKELLEFKDIEGGELEQVVTFSQPTYTCVTVTSSNDTFTELSFDFFLDNTACSVTFTVVFTGRDITNGQDILTTNGAKVKYGSLVKNFFFFVLES